MHTRRILLAFSLAASAASVAFADLVELNPNSNNVSEDRIEQLTRTLAQGSYAESNDIDLPAETRMNVQLREKTIELNNESLAKKYGISRKINII